VNCREAKDILWDLYEGTLPEGVRREVQAHLGACPECARAAAECRLVSDALSPRPMLRAPEAATAAVLERVRPIARRRRALNWVRRNGLTEACLCAAAVLLFLGVLGYLPTGSAEEAGALSRVTAEAGAAAGTMWNYFYQPIADAFDYRAAVSLAVSWLPTALAVVVALVLFAALEEHIFSRRTEAKIRDLLK
jgi:anti-sigma factor RsiW